MMPRRLSYIITVCLMAFVAAGCVYDFVPDAGELQGLEKPLVVIEGDIIVGGETTVVLKSTQPVIGGVEQESISYYGTTVWVEGEDGQVYNGWRTHDHNDDSSVMTFKVNTSSLSTEGRFRLCVSVPGRGEYKSAFKAVAISPQIDSISYVMAPDRSTVEFDVSTHDDSSEPLYCKWTFVEDWESFAEITPMLRAEKGNGDVYMYELSDSDIKERTRCYSKAESKDIYIATTEALSQNVISRSKLNVVAATDRRVSSTYCITVMQTAMDKEAYGYWEGVKASISGTGGLFAPMPNEVRGNIVSTTFPEETVLGYINVSTMTMKRAIYTSMQLMMYSTVCGMASYKRLDDEGMNQWYNLYMNGLKPVEFVMDDNGNRNTNEVWWTTEACVDCRVFSNSTRPDFWPYE